MNLHTPSDFIAVTKNLATLVESSVNVIVESVILKTPIPTQVTEANLADYSFRAE